jgi:hypothetical protein
LCGHIRAKPESCCLSYEEGGNNPEISAEQTSKLAADNGARKQKRLIAIAISAKGIESDGGRVPHY